MAFSFSTTPHRPATRRLRPGLIARRCVGSLIMLAVACILTMDLIALASGAQDAAALATAQPGPTPR